MLICVFRPSPKTPFSPLQKHRKYRCFDSILGLREKENIVNSVVLSLVGAKNIANYDVLGTFLNASFRTTGQKHRKIQCFCCFAILIFNFCFLACCKNIVNTMVFAVCGLPFFPVVCCCSAPRARARARLLSQFLGVCSARARARAARNNNNHNNNNNNNNKQQQQQQQQQQHHQQQQHQHQQQQQHQHQQQQQHQHQQQQQQQQQQHQQHHQQQQQQPKPTKNQLLPPNTNSHSLPRHCRWVR